MYKELNELRQWKKEALEVWAPLLDYCHNHSKGIKVGDSVSGYVLECVKEHEARIERNKITVDLKSTPGAPIHNNSYEDLIKSPEFIEKAKEAIQYIIEKTNEWKNQK